VFDDVFAGAISSKDGIERSLQLWNQMRADFEKSKGK
jgi:hypothetical protein